ncbi:MAG: GNAT family N-acetyltransferase [Proteobacteria bacterium]|nr:GNAT family N-acetyltransferase [Pseudomonadota bacterium]
MRKRLRYKDVWPIDHKAAKPPEGWTGWPDGKKFALVLTHDVENEKGHNNSRRLAEIEESLGFRSSFNFVAKDYPVSAELRQYLTDRKFEVGIHGLHHDKNPFQSRTLFEKQAVEINRYIKEWGVAGFRCPSMYHDLEMIHFLDIEYDASTFDTDPFEPQPDGMGTIFPFMVPGNERQNGYVELPYTLPQDFLLFILMREQNIEIWKKKLDWIAENGGMALFITHPNYMSFDERLHYEEYTVRYYTEFLEYIKYKYEGQYWHALPRDVSRFWTGKYKPTTLSVATEPSSLITRNSLLAPKPYTLYPISLIDPVKDPRWDNFVESHPFGLICHLSGWKQVLEESFPHMKGHYLALLNHEDNSIKAALPVFEVKSILTGNRLVSIPFATNCDPLISSEEDMRALLDAAINLSIKLRCSNIEIRTLASMPLIQDGRIESLVYNKSHQLSLEASPEELIKKFQNKLRQQINKSMRSGLKLQLAENEADLSEFYNLYVKSRKRLGLPPQPYLFFKLLWEKFSSSGRIRLLCAMYKGQLAAGLMIFRFRNRCSCEYLASEESFKNLNINHFVFWEAIKLACSEGYKIFDFGRTGINNEGLMTFKSHWGTSVMDLPQFYYPGNICSDLNCPEETFSYKLIRQISKNVPDPVFQYMGNFLYKHLG